MTNSQIRPRRSVLFMPGSNTRALEKATTLPADVIIMDLEDAVAPSAKDEARANIVAALESFDYGPREVVVRINGYASQWWKDDLVAIVKTRAHALLVPKIEGADVLSKFADLMAINGAEPAMRLWAMVETPRAILNIDAIAGADPRLDVLVMGTSDLAKELRIPPDAGRLGLLPSLAQAIVAARAHQIDILDGVFGDLADEPGFEHACKQGRQLGFDGKTLIHPRQIDPANRIYGVSADEVTAAAQIVTASEEAARNGQGIAIVDGRMVETLHAEQARRVLEMHAAISSGEARAATNDKKE